MNTVGEDEGTRAELINISSGCERTPAQADPGLLPASFSSLKEKKPPLHRPLLRDSLIGFFVLPYLWLSGYIIASLFYFPMVSCLEGY